MAIAFEEFDVEQFRVQIAKLSDDELVKLGCTLHRLCYPRTVAPRKSAFEIQLELSNLKIEQNQFGSPSSPIQNHQPKAK